MTTRQRLPNRRSSQSFGFECGGMAYVATISRFPNGDLAEIFISNHKVGSDADAAARDSAVVASIALQFGAPAAVLRHAVLPNAHREKDETVMLDLLFERKAPFNPSEATGEIATLLKSYGCSQVTGDKYGANWVVEAFAKTGIKYIQSERDRSAIYLDCLPLFTSGRARLIDSARLVAQFAALERRTFSNGRDKVDHGRETSARDDACNSAAGALVLAAGTGGFDSSYLWVGGPSGGEAQPFGRPANNPFAGMYFFDH
jgi:hypothetical protein